MYRLQVKYIPSWLPGAGFQNHGKRWADAAHDMITVPFDLVKKKIASVLQPTCIVC